MLRAIYNSIERRRRPMHDHHYLMLSAVGLAYGRCPNAASDSIRQALLDLSARHAAAPGATPPPRTHYATGTLSNWTDGMALLSARQLKRLHPRALTFAAIRDPLMRLAACYVRDYGMGGDVPASARFLGFQKGMDFDAFTARVCSIPDRKSPNVFRGQADILMHKGRLLPRHLIRFEHQARDWTALRSGVEARNGIDIGPLPECDGTPDLTVETIAGSLDPALRKAVKQRYRNDYELLANPDPSG